jgi:hypothetical protein
MGDMKRAMANLDGVGKAKGFADTIIELTRVSGDALEAKDTRIAELEAELAQTNEALQFERDNNAQTMEVFNELEAAIVEACAVGQSGIMQALAGKDGPVEAHSRLEQIASVGKGYECPHCKRKDEFLRGYADMLRDHIEIYKSAKREEWRDKIPVLEKRLAAIDAEIGGGDDT